VSASCMTISNPYSILSSETELNPGTRSWKTLIWKRSMLESHWWNLFH
jgi:hypothetical protein